ncbi:MAG: hypothetical protein ACTSYF_03500, partial [Promethearchaeota archaeon]
AERLPNNNTLISDAMNNRYIEITMDGNITWEFSNVIFAFDADRIDRFAPDLDINSPLNQTYNSRQVQIELSSDAIDLDKIWISIHDDTHDRWVIENFFVDNDNSYFTQLDDGTYTLYAWANDTYMNSLMLTSDHSSRTNLIPRVITFTVNAVDESLWMAFGLILPVSIFLILLFSIIITKSGFKKQPRSLNIGGLFKRYRGNDRAITIIDLDNETSSKDLLVNFQVENNDDNSKLKD